MAALEGHLLGQGEVIVIRSLPVDQVDGVVGPASRDLHLYPEAQQLVSAESRLVQGNAGGIDGGQEFLQRGGNMRLAENLDMP